MKNTTLFSRFTSEGLDYRFIVIKFNSSLRLKYLFITDYIVLGKQACNLKMSLDSSSFTRLGYASSSFVVPQPICVYHFMKTTCWYNWSWQEVNEENFTSLDQLMIEGGKSGNIDVDDMTFGWPLSRYRISIQKVFPSTPVIRNVKTCSNCQTPIYLHQIISC